jgi:hypothetical protein
MLKLEHLGLSRLLLGDLLNSQPRRCFLGFNGLRKEHSQITRRALGEPVRQSQGGAIVQFVLGHRFEEPLEKTIRADRPDPLNLSILNLGREADRQSELVEDPEQPLRLVSARWAEAELFDLLP